MKLIVAVDEKWNIGYKDELLFYVPDDLKHFKETTINNVVVLGRKTLSTFPGGKPLKGRENIILSSDIGLQIEGADVVNSIAELLAVAEKISGKDVFVIGGASVYEQLLEFCDTAIVTHIHATSEKADRTFPILSSETGWKETNKSEDKESAGYTFHISEYKRI